MRNFIYFLINNVTTLLFIIIEVLCVVLIVNYNSYQRSSFWSSSNVVCGAIYSLQSEVSGYFGLRDVNASLAAENVRLRNLLGEKERMLLQMSDSAKSVALSERGIKYYYREARVINSSTSKSRNSLTLDKGESSGVKVNMAVVDERGVVGMVMATSAHYATVLPLINTSSHLSVKLSKSHFRGQLIWNGGSALRATMIDVPEHAQVLVGDTVVTSGSSSYFPEGLHVGVVEEVSMDRNGGFYSLTVRLGVDFASIHRVEIIENREMDEQLTLEKEVSND